MVGRCLLHRLLRRVKVITGETSSSVVNYYLDEGSSIISGNQSCHVKEKEHIIMISPHSTCHTINIVSQKFPRNSQEISFGDLVMKPKESGSPIKKQKFPLGWKMTKHFT